MLRRMIFPLIFGFGGVAILLELGFWQVHRLAWKQALLAQIEARIADAPVTLPAHPDPARDRYLSVRASGTIATRELDVLTSDTDIGPGFLLISPFVTAAGRRVLLERGFVPEAAKNASRGAYRATVTGNLDWPRESDSFTPVPDLGRNIWFARDVKAMAKALNTDPVLIVARTVTPPTPGVTPVPVDTASIPNNHLNYAITWFSMAFLWFGMTLYLLWRIRQKTI